MQHFALPKFMYISMSGLKFSSLILQLYCVLSIFYVYKSGYPQPADILIAAAIGVALMFFVMKKSWVVTLPIALGLLFAFCTFIINVTNYVLWPDRQFILSSLYYIFNMGIFAFSYSLFKKTKGELAPALVTALIIAICLECIFVFMLNASENGRAIGTFNNPNQLSYWALLVFCLLVALRYPLTFKWYDYGLIGILFLIEMESLSKAALISFMVVFISVAFTRLVNNFGRAILIMIFLALVSFAVFSIESITGTVANLDNIQKTVTRLAEIGQDSDDNLEARGYNRIPENPQFLILGAGEGGYDRFTVGAFELHSGIATLFFSYGISGMVIFGFFLLSILWRLPPIFWILVFSIMLYGLTHQNIRFSFFWLFLGIITAVGELRATKKVQKLPNSTV